MTTPKSNDEEDASGPPTSQTSSPAKTSTPDGGTATSTPAVKAARPNGGANRRRASTTGRPPTLLGDFLLGRPSPARLAAEKKAALERKKELDAVKQEMRQAAVMRIQAPGGVRDRVNKWQKANAEAMANADPYAAPTEPSEVHVQVDEGSVTEQDRERIKWRQKKPAQQKVVAVKQRQGQPPTSTGQNKETARPNNPPKKRVVSDTNWVKNAKKNTPQLKTQPPKPKQNTGSGQPLPKNFLQRPAANPSVAKKVQAWASKVEIPDDPAPKRHIASRSVGSSEGLRMRNIGAESDTRSSKSESAYIVVEEEPDTKKSQKEKGLQDDGIRVKPVRKKIYETDGIRVRPQKSPSPPDDGIRVYASPQGSQSSLPDDGIRVYASSQGSRSTSTVRAPSRKPSKKMANARATGSRRARPDSPPSDRIEVIEDPESEVFETPTRRPSRRVSNPRRSRHKKPAPRSVSDRHTMVTGTTDTGTTVTGTTKTGTSATGTRPTRSSVTGTTQTGTEVTGTTQTGTTVTEDVSDSESWTSSSSSSSAEESDQQSTALPSCLADIPVGYSAFSVLDLPGDNKDQNSRRPRANRQTSFKGATNVLKKVLTEGKKMMTEKVEPPKPAANQPPNIENWLKGTVDPFVEGPSKAEAESHHRKSTEKEWVEESKSRQSTPPTSKPTAKAGPVEPSPVPSSAEKSREHIPPEEPRKPPVEEIRPDEREVSNPSSNSLKRSRATRISSYPLRPNAKRGFKDKLRDAFRGESTGHSYMPPPEYPSCSTILDLDDDPDDEHWDDRRSSETPRGLPPSDDEESLVSSEPPKQQQQPLQQKRRPPTNGHHELSTIVSEESSRSTRETDMSSVVSASTVTQTTAFSRSTRTGADVARKRSQKSGLKRRLTKHSDLISVLSLPDDETVPKRGNSLRSARSVRRASNNLDNATVESLLREFAGDENLYQRELKTLVDGVVPVLLTQVIHGEGNGPKDLFGSPSAKPRRDMLSKAVVDMGVALEKLRNLHKRCPLLDVHRLPHWLESVHTVYDRYLDVWRLGFQGVIVNLAPAALDDDSSLVNAMPRNEDGDVLNEDGERIDVAHLLKRPLVRVKWIAKFIKGYRFVTGTENYESLAAKWEWLQEKARRRHKEETARAVDDDATYTDTSRARDLETLEELDNVKIDRYRQVYAKDTFSLDLRHSNGQRLVCQVELISRDNPVFKSDPGDLLIREIGSGGRSWLLFAPISGGDYSARKGDDAYQLVVMIRGYSDEWYELLTLAADDKEQILDWLEILGTHPVPPAIKRGISVRRPHTSVSSSRSAALDIPLGERRPSQRHSAAPPPLRPAEISRAKRQPSPDRNHMRTASLPVTPTTNSAPKAPSLSPETTPTQKSQRGSQPPPPAYPPPFIPAPNSPPPAIPPPSSSPPAPPIQARDDEEDLRPEPLRLRKSSPNSTPNSTPFREDGAPPPPVHRTFSQKSPNLAPPQEKSSGRIKRRTSSPLKHEYHPSDISTDASSSMSGTDDDYDDYDDHERPDGYDDDYSVSSESSDELEAADIPDTVPAISVKQPEWSHNQSFVSESVDSLTPSASASQAELSKVDDNTQSYVFKSLASISYWDNKHGCWKDLWPDVCSIVTTPGLIEAYPHQRIPSSSGNSPKSEDRPLIALDLTPLVMLRNSTALDLEIRSPVLSYARLYPKLNKVETSFFRFRASSFQECESLYLGVHRARMDNAKYKALEEETRIRSFGQQQPPSEDGDASTSRRRSWFGRKNSYRASARAPSQSAGSLSSTMSATSFLKRLMGGHQSFNIAMSSIDRPQSSRPGSTGGDPSLYSSHSSPRSPSVSLAHSGGMANHPLTTNNLKIRLHLLVSASKWEDHGNCTLEVTRPDAGARQNLRKYQGMEKRIIVHTLNKKHPEKEKLVLDVVLGSRCFSRLGSRGVLLNVWEETAGAGEGDGPRDRGNSGGLVSKWCFQCASVAEAAWIYGLVTQEVIIG